MAQQNIRVDCMTVAQTAGWVEALGNYYNWEEAAVYAENFVQNEIWGNLLLKTDLEILHYEHRLKIMMAIRHLFPSMESVEDRETMEIEIGGPMLQSSSMALLPWASKMDVSPCIGPVAEEE